MKKIKDILKLFSDVFHNRFRLVGYTVDTESIYGEQLVLKTEALVPGLHLIGYNCDFNSDKQFVQTHEYSVMIGERGESRAYSEYVTREGSDLRSTEPLACVGDQLHIPIQIRESQHPRRSLKNHWFFNRPRIAKSTINDSPGTESNFSFKPEQLAKNLIDLSEFPELEYQQRLVVLEWQIDHFYAQFSALEAGKFDLKIGSSRTWNSRHRRCQTRPVVILPKSSKVECVVPAEHVDMYGKYQIARYNHLDHLIMRTGDSFSLEYCSAGPAPLHNRDEVQPVLSRQEYTKKVKPKEGSLPSCDNWLFTTFTLSD